VAIVAFFGVALASTAAFVLWATTQRVDLVTADYYAREIAYQQQIDRMERARAMENRLEVTYDPDDRAVRVLYPPEMRAGVLDGEVWCYRPSNAALDHRTAMAPDTNGVQTLPTESMRPGLWKLRLNWRLGDEEYYQEETVVIARDPSNG
jgi:nitrogen fixation protein FixH